MVFFARILFVAGLALFIQGVKESEANPVIPGMAMMGYGFFFGRLGQGKTKAQRVKHCKSLILKGLNNPDKAALTSTLQQERSSVRKELLTEFSKDLNARAINVLIDAGVDLKTSKYLYNPLFWCFSLQQRMKEYAQLKYSFDKQYYYSLGNDEQAAECAKLLVKAGVNPNHALPHAVMTLNTVGVKVLLDGGADVGKDNGKGLFASLKRIETKVNKCTDVDEEKKNELRQRAAEITMLLESKGQS